MKVMSRDFTMAEKLLLILLAFILVGLGYYYFVDQPVRSTIANYQAEATSLQTELDVLEARIAHLRQVQSSMDELEEKGNLSWMGSYNNSEAEVRFLNDILANTLKYSISFADVSRSGDQIRRSFTLQYKTLNYASAQDITARLCQGENRCLVGDVKCSIDNTGVVTINEAATFFETMVGGTPDAALPKDTAATK